MARSMTAEAAMKQSAAGTNPAPLALRPLERREIFELFKASINFPASQRTESLDAGTLAAEAAHHGPVDHGTPQLVRVHPFVLHVNARARQITHEATGETI